MKFEKRINIGEIYDLLKFEAEMVLNGSTNLVPVIAGAPGIGKSAIIKKQYGEYCLSMIRTRSKVNDNLPIYPYCSIILWI